MSEVRQNDNKAEVYKTPKLLIPVGAAACSRLTVARSLLESGRLVLDRKYRRDIYISVFCFVGLVTSEGLVLACTTRPNLWLMYSLPSVLWLASYRAFELLAVPKDVRNSIAELGALEDRDSIPAFLAMAMCTDLRARRTARLALINTLTSVDEVYGETFTVKDKQRMNRLLFSTDALLVHAVLHAVSATRDPGAIPFLRSLAAGTHASREDPSVRHSAVEVIDDLMRRQRELQNPSTLVRPTETPGGPSVQLLRATVGHFDTGVVLVRPAEGTAESNNIKLQG